MHLLPSGKTRDNLWTLITPPTVWAWHFLLSYITAAYACAPNDAIFEAIPGPRLLVAVLTVVALAIIAWCGVRAWREWQSEYVAPPFNEASPAHRERFLEFSTLLLAGLSFVGVVFVAMPALFVVDCR
ncbi:hypothetical protein [Antarcticirhabdus aurantiaca]|uniref:Uncharacterized protein n=1 Tax=Antarcticirhabdus aurantiaca TaxID=2606717 RepID=A0ACD4NTP2_9HYPH|nr:hypothetical protein [Antarcticirhabdus aurantiaca]WAJ30225.1 hypothetical protein OXU80_08475 [Jeongeuplla avenae]